MSDLILQYQVLLPAVVEKKPVVMNTEKANEFFKNFPKDKVVALMQCSGISNLSRQSIELRQVVH